MLSWWCSGNNISLYSYPPDLRCNFTPPSCTIVLRLLLELASKLLLQYLAIFSSLCLKARYQPESLPHLFQVFVENTPSQGHSTYFLSFFVFFFFFPIVSPVHFSYSVVSNSLQNPNNCSTLGFPVHHQLPELVQIHVHRVGDAIQPSHPLLSPSPPTFNLSQHQGLFQ